MQYNQTRYSNFELSFESSLPSSGFAIGRENLRYPISESDEICNRSEVAQEIGSSYVSQSITGLFWKPLIFFSLTRCNLIFVLICCCD